MYILVPSRSELETKVAQHSIVVYLLTGDNRGEHPWRGERV
jgi:hypothetical protein